MNTQTGKWNSVGNGVFLGHMTEGQVEIDKEDSVAQKLADFGARICVRFNMNESYFTHAG